MLVRCLRSSFVARRFFCSSSAVESFFSSTVATRLTNAEVSTKSITNSNMPACCSDGTLTTWLFSVQKSDSKGAAAVIAKWKEMGRFVPKSKILYAVHVLRHRYEFAKALMIFDSMVELKDFKLSPHDYALHISLIFKVRGLQSAEQYFDGIPKEMKNETTWTALLHILAKKGETAKAEALMEEMKKSGFLPNPNPYIHMMTFYFSKKQFDKAEEMYNEVKKCIPPDVRIYNKWLSACAFGKDVEYIERAFAQMKEAKVEANWMTHSTLAWMYMKRELFEKAGAALKDLEDVGPPSTQIYCSLIRMHGSMGNKDEVMRIWGELKSETQMSNSVYAAMVGTLLKLNLSEKAEEVFKEWESFPKSSSAHGYPVFRSMLLRKDGKMTPGSIPEHAEEDKFESPLGLDESQQL